MPETPYDLSIYLDWLSDTDRAELLGLAKNSDDINRPWRSPWIELPKPWPPDLVIIRRVVPGMAPIAPPTRATAAAILTADRLRNFRTLLRILPPGADAWPELPIDLVELCSQDDDALLADAMPRLVREAVLETGLRARQVWPQVFGWPPERAAAVVRDAYRSWAARNPALVQVRFERPPGGTDPGSSPSGRLMGAAGLFNPFLPKRW